MRSILNNKWKSSQALKYSPVGWTWQGGAAVCVVILDASMVEVWRDGLGLSLLGCV